MRFGPCGVELAADVFGSLSELIAVAMHGLVERIDSLVVRGVALGERVEPAVDLGEQILDLPYGLLGGVAAGLLHLLHAFGDLALKTPGLLDLTGHPLHDRGDRFLELAHLLDSARDAGFGLAEVFETLIDRLIELLDAFGQAVHLVGVDARAGLVLVLALLEQAKQTEPLVTGAFEGGFEFEPECSGGVAASRGVGGIGQGETSVSEMRCQRVLGQASTPPRRGMNRRSAPAHTHRPRH